MAVIWSRTKARLFTMYAGSTRELLMEEFFGCETAAVIERLEAGEVLYDDAGTVWFAVLPAKPVRKLDDRIAFALDKYGDLLDHVLARLVGSTARTIRLRVNQSTRFEIVAWQPGSQGSGSRRPIIGLRHTEQNSMKGGM